jgi:hypothetical protein
MAIIANTENKGGIIEAEAKPRTILDWLTDLSNTNQSVEQDSIKMQNLLHRVGFLNAVVVCGIVYLEGKGTIEAPPTDIHTIAKMLMPKDK